MKNILFYRDRLGFNGSQLKVRHYYDHSLITEAVAPLIFIEPNQYPRGLWADLPSLSTYDPYQADILFLSGQDWKALEGFGNVEEHVPVINLIQSLGHASPTDPRFAFLERKASRICVSGKIAEALMKTGVCKGEIHTIENCIDIRPQSTLKTIDLLICGQKRPNLARKVARRLEQKSVNCTILTQFLPRKQYLGYVAASDIVVTLPFPIEGFYLPALEAMALGCAVICPPCVGNESYCEDRTTCLCPSLDADEIIDAIELYYANAELRDKIRANGLKVAEKYHIGRERSEFQAILRGLI